MRNFSRIVLSVICTFAVTGLFAQCKAGGCGKVPKGRSFGNYQNYSYSTPGYGGQDYSQSDYYFSPGNYQGEFPMHGGFQNQPSSWSNQGGYNQYPQSGGYSQGYYEDGQQFSHPGYPQSMPMSDGNPGYYQDYQGNPPSGMMAPSNPVYSR